MALFTGAKDKDLPLLTTFFQVDMPHADEDVTTSEIFQWLAAAKGNIRPPSTDDDLKTLELLRELLIVTKRVMMQLSKEQRLSRSDIQELNRLLMLMGGKSTKTIFSQQWRHDESGPQEDIIDPRRYFVGIQPNAGLSFDAGLGEKIIEDLVGHMATPERFSACPECESIYLRLNPRTVYCSVRCGQRHLMRERQRRQKKQSIRLDKPNEVGLYSNQEKQKAPTP